MLWIQENLRGLLDPIVEGYTTLGNTGLMWIVLSLAMLCWKPTRKAGVAALAAMVLGLLCMPFLALLPASHPLAVPSWLLTCAWACPACMWGSTTPAM